MTSGYRLLPGISSSSRWALRRRQTRQYMFALLLLLTLVFMSLYEFYFTIVERSKDGEHQANVLQQILCHAFMLTLCPKKENSELLQLRSKINELNLLQTTRNFDGEELMDNRIVILIQVHDRAVYLNQLIMSLSVVVDIHLCLLVFSHDYYDEGINQMVADIDFAPVMQIFYPVSIQLYPNEFPGTSPNDCPRDIGVDEALIHKCTGVADEYGHFREARITQPKHHWWWMTNRVFDGLNITKHFDGFVLYLEEDHVVSPDLVYTLQQMSAVSASSCPQCTLLSLGIHDRQPTYRDDIDKVDIGKWSNLAFAFNRTLWRHLRACSTVYCTFDDYNFDCSFLYTAQECFSQKLIPLTIRSSRVFHMGDCGGLHHKEKNCDFNKGFNEVLEFIHSVQPVLFPPTLTVDRKDLYTPRVKKGWGGWSDPRDIQLCLNNSAPTTTS